MKIGVFDSGIGGKSVSNAIQKAYPDYEVLYRQDRKNVPYGSKSSEELLQLVTPILDDLAQQGCDVVVIACNSVTTTIIKDLRQTFNMPIIGIEPMIKPASEQTKTGVIAVCATTATLNSHRYHELVNAYAKDKTVLQPDCTEWANMIEQNDINHKAVYRTISSVCRSGADIIVLGCTHYHWIELQVQQIAHEYGARVIQPEAAIVRHLKRVIEQLD